MILAEPTEESSNHDLEVSSWRDGWPISHNITIMFGSFLHIGRALIQIRFDYQTKQTQFFYRLQAPPFLDTNFRIIIALRSLIIVWPTFESISEYRFWYGFLNVGWCHISHLSPGILQHSSTCFISKGYSFDRKHFPTKKLLQNFDR